MKLCPLQHFLSLFWPTYFLLDALLDCIFSIGQSGTEWSNTSWNYINLAEKRFDKNSFLLDEDAISFLPMFYHIWKWKVCLFSNDRRSSGGTLRQNFNPIDIWHLAFDSWYLIFVIWHLTFAIQPMDQWTNGPMDHWTNGPMDQWTNCPMDQWSNGPMVPLNNGLMVVMDQWTMEPMDQ